MNENKQAQEGSGSAENKGGNRNDQKHPLTNPSNGEKRDIAHEINEDESHLAGLKDMGHLSGRDDYAGAAGDGMSAQSTNEETER
jgi:hypothetical protein